MTSLTGHHSGREKPSHLASQSPGTEQHRCPVLPGEDPEERGDSPPGPLDSSSGEMRFTR